MEGGVLVKGVSRERGMSGKEKQKFDLFFFFLGLKIR